MTVFDEEPERETVALVEDLVELLERPSSLELVQIAAAVYATADPSPRQVAEIAAQVTDLSVSLHAAKAHWATASIVAAAADPGESR